MGKCTQCGAKAGFMMSLCEACEEAKNKKRIEEYAGQTEHEDAHEVKFEKEVISILLTTAPSLEGYRIIKTLDIITSECVFGMNIFRDMFAAFSDVFGGRSVASQKVLRDARKICLYELKKEAYVVGANAVIAVDLDYSEFSGGGKSMLFLVASGTAVKIQKLQKSTFNG